MKKIKQVIFSLAVFALLWITGSMDNGEISIKSAVILSAVDFAVIVWSGFTSGLLVLPDKICIKLHKKTYDKSYTLEELIEYATKDIEMDGEADE